MLSFLRRVGICGAAPFGPDWVCSSCLSSLSLLCARGSYSPSQERALGSAVLCFPSCFVLSPLSSLFVSSPRSAASCSASNLGSPQGFQPLCSVAGVRFPPVPVSLTPPWLLLNSVPVCHLVRARVSCEGPREASTAIWSLWLRGPGVLASVRSAGGCAGEPASGALRRLLGFWAPGPQAAGCPCRPLPFGFCAVCHPDLSPGLWGVDGAEGKASLPRLPGAPAVCAAAGVPAATPHVLTHTWSHRF